MGLSLVPRTPLHGCPCLLGAGCTGADAACAHGHTHTCAPRAAPCTHEHTHVCSPCCSLPGSSLGCLLCNPAVRGQGPGHCAKAARSAGSGDQPDPEPHQLLLQPLTVGPVPGTCPELGKVMCVPQAAFSVTSHRVSVPEPHTGVQGGLHPPPPAWRPTWPYTAEHQPSAPRCPHRAHVGLGRSQLWLAETPEAWGWA